MWPWRCCIASARRAHARCDDDVGDEASSAPHSPFAFFSKPSSASRPPFCRPLHPLSLSPGLYTAGYVRPLVRVCLLCTLLTGRSISNSGRCACFNARCSSRCTKSHPASRVLPDTHIRRRSRSLYCRLVPWLGQVRKTRGPPFRTCCADLRVLRLFAGSTLGAARDLRRLESTS